MKPSNEPPQSDIAPVGYPSTDQHRHPTSPPMQPNPYSQQSAAYRQQGDPYGQQAYYQHAYTQPNAQHGYAYPPMAATQPASYPPNGYAASPHGAKPPYQGYSTAPYYDPEAARMAEAAMFAEKTVRLGFVRKVFAILSIMMAITVSVVLVFMYVDAVHDYLRANVWPFWTAFALSFGTLIYLTCNPRAARKSPSNLIFLFLFTLCQSVLIGTVTMYSSPEAVLIAAAATLGVTIALTLFATQSKFDFTMKGGILIGALMILLICILLGFFIRVKWFYVVISGLGALLFCAFLVYDIQLIMGKGRYALSPDDYVFGALALYLDIINIFLYILSIIGLVKND